MGSCRKSQVDICRCFADVDGLPWALGGFPVDVCRSLVPVGGFPVKVGGCRIGIGGFLVVVGGFWNQRS